MKSETHHVLTLRIPVALLPRLRELATKRGRSLNNLMVELAKAAVNRKSP